MNYCATCLDAVSWGTRSPLFHRSAPQRGSLPLSLSCSESGGDSESSCDDLSRPRSPPPPPPPRPVASWGPRYRYDVDIWRALLLHPRPACISLLARAGPEWSLLDVTCGVPGSNSRIFKPIVRLALCGGRRALVHAILPYYKAVISETPLSHTCRQSAT